LGRIVVWHIDGSFSPEDGVSMFYRNIGTCPHTVISQQINNNQLIESGSKCKPVFKKQCWEELTAYFPFTII
jgi:hypothetical protein